MHAGYYTQAMDTWGVGCVFFEVVSLFPLFPGAPRTPLPLPHSCWV
jgi:renal tumor antigen